MPNMLMKNSSKTRRKKTGIKVMDWQNPANKTKNSRSMYVDNNGYLRDSSIVKKTIPELTQGILKVVHAIVLHRTESSNIGGSFYHLKKIRLALIL